MRNETELKWSFNLIGSNKISNTFWVEKGDTKSNIQKYACCGTNNKIFNNWFNKLIKLGILKFMGNKKNEKGSDSELFSLNRIKLLDYLEKNNSLYNNCYDSVMLHFKKG